MKHSLSGLKNHGMIIMAVVFLSIVIAFVAGSVIVKAENTSDQRNYTKHFTSICVEPGDTLWDISSEYMDSTHYDDVYDHMNEVIQMNHLTSDELTVGQVILVPYYEVEE